MVTQTIHNPLRWWAEVSINPPHSRFQPYIFHWQRHTNSPNIHCIFSIDSKGKIVFQVKFLVFDCHIFWNEIYFRFKSCELTTFHNANSLQRKSTPKSQYSTIDLLNIEYRLSGSASLVYVTRCQKPAYINITWYLPPANYQWDVNWKSRWMLRASTHKIAKSIKQFWI